MFFSDEVYEMNYIGSLIKKIESRTKISFEQIKNYVLSKYNLLLNKFGYQNWWPTLTKNKEIEVIIGAILTQNTSWKQVEKSLDNLMKHNLISLKLISEIEKNEEFVINLIRPSGFAKRKVETIKETLIWYKNNKNKIKNRKIRELREELLKIKGIGKETADSIILYAFEKPIFVIDTYTKRTLKRDLGLELKNYDLLRIIFELSFLNETNKTFIFKEYHALIVEENKRLKAIN